MIDNCLYGKHYGKPYILTNTTTFMATKYVTVSVKIPMEIKEKLERAGIKPSKVAKDALFKALKEVEIQEFKNVVKDVEDIFKKIPDERIVENIREDRER